MDANFTVGDIFTRGKTYPSEWKIIRIKLIFNVVHYELEGITSPKKVMLSEWALLKDSNWKLARKSDPI